LARCERGIAALEFALIAPVLLSIVFATIVYSLYFTAVLGVRHAAAEGARAAMAGLSTGERITLAKTRANAVIDKYGSLLSTGNVHPVVTPERESTGVFKVTVTYNIASAPLMRFASFLPLPAPDITSSVIVTNGSY
jgi:Flp pilus assembly protein TadG